MKKQKYVICYDISSNKGRRKIEKICVHFGRRVQYSVFECYLTKSQLEELNTRLKKEFKFKEIDQEEDSVRIYKFCKECQNELNIHGKKLIISEEYMII